MTEAILRFFENTFSNPAVGTILIAMLPIVELKGAIPFAVAYYKCSLPLALLYGLIGSSIMIPLYLWLLIPLINRFKKTRVFGRFFSFVERIFVKRANKVTANAEAKATARAGKDAAATKTEEANRLNAETKVSALEQSPEPNEKQTQQKNSGAENGKQFRRKKNAEWYKTVGIFTLVAIPIPLTGVLTGSAAAAFLRLDFKKSLLTIFAGNIIAGIIVTLTTGLFV
jgi:uncharacterized membrane protein